MVDIEDRIRKIFMKSGAVSVGFASACEVEAGYARSFSEWLESGCNAGMAYMANHAALRKDPHLLLEGTSTVISLAFPFAPDKFRDNGLGMIACYAYGLDYHDIIRLRLSEAVKEAAEEFGGEYRICIDSAPVAERYWAVKAGVGFRGDNGSVIVPGHGGMVFLAEVLTTLKLTPDTPLKQECLHCGACTRACPGKALKSDGTVDSRRCISYLTIEHRGEWTEPEAIETMSTPAGENAIFGCDICLRACPLNKNIPATSIPEFRPLSGLMELSRAELSGLSPESFSRLFKDSPIKRAKLAGILRNIRK